MTRQPRESAKVQAAWVRTLRLESCAGKTGLRVSSRGCSLGWMLCLRVGDDAWHVCRRWPDTNQDPLAGLLGHEAARQQRIDGPSLELVVAVRESQPIGQVRGRRQFFGSQNPTIRVCDSEPRGDLRIRPRPHLDLRSRRRCSFG